MKDGTDTVTQRFEYQHELDSDWAEGVDSFPVTAALVVVSAPTRRRKPATFVVTPRAWMQPDALQDRQLELWLDNE